MTAQLAPSTARRFLLLCVALVAAHVVFSEAQDFYGLLGVSRGASESEIRAKFKKLAKTYHPDAGRGLTDDKKEEHRKMYTRISEAYETLTDSKRRQRYDQGARGQHVGVDRNYLRHNLFSDDFSGEQIKADDIHDALQGKAKRGLIVFFWSNNFPNCIDAGLEYKKAAARLKTSSLRVAALRCDDHVQICRDVLRIPGVPSIGAFAPSSRQFEVYTGKYEQQLLVDYAMKYVRQIGTIAEATREALEQRCPHVAPVVAAGQYGWAAPYFFETAKRSYGGTYGAPFVILEHSQCFDCGTELTLALESYRYVDPKPLLHRIDCVEAFGPSADLCAEGAAQHPNRAWSILRFSKRCHYATQRPYSFTHEHCTDTVDWFGGRFVSTDFLTFLLQGAKPRVHTIRALDEVRRSNDSWAILYSPSADLAPLGETGLQWTMLSARVEQFPIRSDKGFAVRVAVLDCSAGACGSRAVPSAALFSFGLKAKAVDPHPIEVSSVSTMVSMIRKEMEPLHLHLLTPGTFKAKLNGGLNKGRAWLILYNAGEWCPPCMQLKPHWPRVARMVQQGAMRQRLSVGLVNCDKHSSICKSENLDGFPSVIFYPGKDKERRIFNGQRSAEGVLDWVREALESNVQRLSYHELQHAINTQRPVLASFTAGQWCPPCNMLGPVLKQVSNKVPKLAVSEVNCDDDQMYCQQFSIEGYPSLLLFWKGQRLSFNPWRRSADDIVEWIRTSTHQTFA